jgi:hypothetical protein
MIPTRLAKYAAIFTVILAVGVYTVYTLREQGRAEMRPVIERLQAELNNERAARIRNEEALDAYQKELSVIRSRPRPATPVRLCVSSPVPDAEQSTTSVDDSAPFTRSSAGLAGEYLTAGPDIGPRLRDLAYGCDAENAKLRALQNWIKSWVN